LSRIVRIEDVRRRPGLAGHYAAGWGGWTSLSRTPVQDYENVRKTFATADVHEEDFRLFANFDGRPGLFVDVGANMGFSAISFRNVNATMRILSFEILPWLEGVLKLVRADVANFDFRMFGVSDQTRSATLYVPVYVDLLCTPWASLDRGQFELPHRRAEWHTMTGADEIELVEVPIALRALDDLNLAPTIIKIDVEGVELPTLRGMRRTLAAYRPLVMIEKNDDLRFVQFMEGLGYEAMGYDARANAMWRLDPGPIPVLNAFFVHRERRAALTDRGIRLPPSHG